MWWSEGVFYQIYPRSFFDSNSDGVGDLPGIASKLSYLKWLGVDAFWISPFYPSPMKDFGYDISDYRNVDQVFGTLDNFKTLLEEAKRLELKIIIDFVPNHSSDLHPWFIESKSARDNSKRDWYVWRDGKIDGSPPNNWQSRFDGESSWEYDETTQQYYLHSFLKEQPDLNWRNPEVQTEMLNTMRFWLDMGVDGFRVDASYYCMKDPGFRDNPKNEDWEEGMDPACRLMEVYSKNFTDIHAFNRLLREVTEEYGNKVLVGELYLPFDKLVCHYGENNEYHMPFNFSLINSDWKAEVIADLIVEYEKHLPQGAWPNWVLGNHDKSRLASRVGKAQVRNSLLLLLSLRGTPTIYYGEELGLENGVIPPEYIQDPQEKYVPGLGLGRDPERTPMLWNSSPYAGFSDKLPWLPVHHNFATVNVEYQQEDQSSILQYTKALLSFRRNSEILVNGNIEILSSDDNVLTFTRSLALEKLLIVVNISSKDKSIEVPQDLQALDVVFETNPGVISITNKSILCPGNQGGIIRIK